MGEWTTLSVRDSTAERFNELKQNTGDEETKPLTANEFLKSLLDAWEENGESIYGDFTALNDIKNQLDRIESAQGDTVSEALDVAEASDNTDVLNRLDDLETELSTQHERMQR